MSEVGGECVANTPLCPPATCKSQAYIMVRLDAKLANNLVAVL